MAEATDEAPDGEALWQFSLAFYPCPGVAEALIALQDRAGCDVNLMLFVLWLGVSGRGRLTREELMTALRMARPIRVHIVEPLRALRRKLKPCSDEDVQRLRDAIKATEIAAEKVIQIRLCRTARPMNGGADPAARNAAARANLGLYLGPELACSPEASTIGKAVDGFLPG
jgi:uncharacterized protein (TIGR02444 family)